MNAYASQVDIIYYSTRTADAEKNEQNNEHYTEYYYSSIPTMNTNVPPKRLSTYILYSLSNLIKCSFRSYQLK
jgi:hypothetical protein